MIVAQTPLALGIYVVVSLLLPILVDLVSKRMASSRVKAVILLVLSLVTGGLTEYLTALNQNASFEWRDAVYAAVISFVLGTASFFGLAAPLGVSGFNGGIQKSLPGGIGSVATPAQATLADVDTPATDPLMGDESP